MAQDTGFSDWLKSSGYMGDESSGYYTADDWFKSVSDTSTNVGFGRYLSTPRDALQKKSSAELQGVYSSGLQQQAVTKSAQAANSVASPGQDVFSKKLAGMANGQFSTDDPSYQWRLQQGEQAVERSAAAKGQLGSGNVLTALTDYAQGAASTEYGAQFSRMLQGSENATNQYSTAYNSLAQMMSAQTGQASASSQASTSAANSARANRAQDFTETTAKNQSAGASDALASIYSNPTGQSYWNQQDQITQQQNQNQTYTLNGYQPQQSTYETSVSGFGSWQNDSTGTGGSW